MWLRNHSITLGGGCVRLSGLAVVIFATVAESEVFDEILLI